MKRDYRKLQRKWRGIWLLVQLLTWITFSVTSGRKNRWNKIETLQFFIISDVKCRELQKRSHTFMMETFIWINISPLTYVYGHFCNLKSYWLIFNRTILFSWEGIGIFMQTGNIFSTLPWPDRFLPYDKYKNIIWRTIFSIFTLDPDQVFVLGQKSGWEFFFYLKKSKYPVAYKYSTSFTHTKKQQACWGKTCSKWIKK